MIPLKQKYKHDPENGIYGDCYRTCIASILEMNIEEVPHFFKDFKEGDDWAQEANDWFNQNGLVNVSFAFYEHPGEYMAQENTGVYYILTGEGKLGVNHSVVMCDNDIVCDPSSSGIIGPCKDSELYWIEFFLLPIMKKV